MLRNQVQDCSTSLFLIVPLHLERAYGYQGRWYLTDEYYPSFWSLPWCCKLSELYFWTWRNVTEVFQLFFCSERFKVSNQLMNSCIEKPGVFQSQPPPSRGHKWHNSGARFIKNPCLSSACWGWSHLATSNFCCAYMASAPSCSTAHISVPSGDEDSPLRASVPADCISNFMSK